MAHFVKFYSFGFKKKQNISSIYVYMEKKMAAYSRVLAWEIPWTEEPWRATAHGVAKELDMT